MNLIKFLERIKSTNKVISQTSPYPWYGFFPLSIIGVPNLDMFEKFVEWDNT